MAHEDMRFSDDRMRRPRRSACLLKLISYAHEHPINDKARRSMKFQQLRYLVAVHENGLNITAAARQLHTSQPGSAAS
jgi:hypothetical protein